MEPPNLQREWARLIIDGLVSAGVRDAIISPGSRSAPFVCAALEQPNLRCTSVLDERSAAFFALGQARATGIPSLLICTSGSAAANYFPAVVEASEANVPLVILSADRPPELHHCGANQTTDQLHLYGSRVRFFANLGEPIAREASLRAVRRTALRAVSEALGVRPGPVHLNAQAREPLEPQEGTDARSTELAALCKTLRGQGEVIGATPPPMVPDPAHIDWLAAACARAERGLFVCGPGTVEQGQARQTLAFLAKRTGFPIVAEACSQFRFMPEATSTVLGASDALWRSKHVRGVLQPDLVLQIGAAPVSKGWSQLMAEDFPRQHVLLSSTGWPDPTGRVSRIIRGSIPTALSMLARAVDDRGDSPSRAWRERVEAAEHACWEVAASVLSEAEDDLTEGGVAAHVSDALPEGAAFVLGNSLPIREVDSWARPQNKPLDVFCQRGVSGIDGIVSGAAGVASKRGTPTALLLGDVSFLHDVSGLETATETEAPFVIVVVNNGGGRIFEQLPIAHANPAAMSYFTTPHSAALSHAAGLYGLTFCSVGSISDLGAELRRALDQPRCTIIEARVPPHGALEQNRRLWQEVDRRFEGKPV